MKATETPLFERSITKEKTHNRQEFYEGALLITVNFYSAEQSSSTRAASEAIMTCGAKSSEVNKS
jgi:hypothetical protein